MKIVNRNGHYEAYIDGKFICSGDTESECKKDLEEHLNSLNK